MAKTYLKLTGATPSTSEDANINAVVDGLDGKTIQELKELSDVAGLEDEFGVGEKTDGELAVLLESFRYWEDDDLATRTTTVTARRVTLDALR